MANLRLLSYLASALDATAADVAAVLELSLPAAGMLLLRATRSGLVGRIWDADQQCFLYGLTEKGRARITFFERGAH
jgi:DNA-binding MarR family transcriptional regulator